MSMFKVLRRWMLGERLARERRPLKELEREIAHELVKQFSEGNISLQMGWYLTEEDVNRLRQEVYGRHSQSGGKPKKLLASPA